MPVARASDLDVPTFTRQGRVVKHQHHFVKVTVNIPPVTADRLTLLRALLRPPKRSEFEHALDSQVGGSVSEAGLLHPRRVFGDNLRHGL
jgi:hypothetical protein